MTLRLEVSNMKNRLSVLNKIREETGSGKKASNVLQMSVYSPVYCSVTNPFTTSCLLMGDIIKFIKDDEI